MGFGRKTLSFKVQQDYTPEQMLDLIKATPFTAGEPKLVKYALTYRIVWPAIDRNNQVQLLKTGQKKWAVCNLDEATGEAMAANIALSSALGSIMGIIQAFSANSKKAVKLVDETYNILTSLNL